MKRIENPSPGGWLAVFNSAFWLAFVLALNYLPQSWRLYDMTAFRLLLILMALPIYWPALFPAFDYQPSRVEVLFWIGVLGANSFIWGYAIKSVGHRLRKWHLRSRRPNH